jgi:hypothetical protein
MRQMGVIAQEKIRFFSRHGTQPTVVFDQPLLLGFIVLSQKMFRLMITQPETVKQLFYAGRFLFHWKRFFDSIYTQ